MLKSRLIIEQVATSEHSGASASSGRSIGAKRMKNFPLYSFSLFAGVEGIAFFFSFP